MEILIIVGLYLIGCVLAYGRVVASFYEIEERFVKFIPLSAYTSNKHFLTI